MMEPSDRLQKARQEAGYENAVDAARAFGWGQSTYISHENGTRGLKPPVAERYAKAFRVTPEWLLYGKTKKAALTDPTKKMVPLVGYVGAGAAAYFFGDQGDLDDVPAPEGATETTVAVEIRGDSLGALFDRWLVFYDDVHRPVTADQVGKLCVVGLPDGRILIKKLQRSRARQGLFHLLSNAEAPILDVEIEWAAKVLNMVPQ
jgi:SOS-response transcriptional repressor LexA